MENNIAKGLPTRFTHIVPTLEQQESDDCKIIYHFCMAYNHLREKEEKVATNDNCSHSLQMLGNIRKQIHDLAYMIDDILPGTLADEVSEEINDLKVELDKCNDQAMKLHQRILELEDE